MGSSLLAMEPPQPGAEGTYACSPGVSAQATVRVGTRMGDYLLMEVIGEDGMRAVYRGRHVVTDVQVAIRVLHDHKKELVEQLVDGAKAAGAVHHANLVAVMDVGSTPEGTVFVVTESLEGESLQARLRRGGRLPPFEAINILRQMAHGLGAAHEAGLVHGGLNPSRIFLCQRKGRRRLVRHSGDMTMYLAIEPEDSFDLVKLLDLGLATQVAAPGMPHYESPEQAEGKPADRRSDIYSLGAIFHEMITGTAPLPCESLADLLGQLAAAVLTMACRRAPRMGIDGQVDEIIVKCLERKPRLRFANTAELCEALDACVTDCAFLRDAPSARQPAGASMTTNPARAQRPSPPPIPRSRPLACGRAQPPPIPRAAKATPVMRKAPGHLIPLPHIPRHSAAVRGTPPPIPLASDLLTEIFDGGC